ncbi:MAG: RNA polymerase subunit sigma [Candidatus Dactylopiibacterium carminicum]|uniref:sigma-70 family RNA polymerase sigma factor n=1 Tax=Candidatus Dactylopiibacterium carminicum TaxID=857335 RepID=UPI000BDDE54D|nr:sigma-70 family RNA polymerase sigma factor [Candidatus Dactylopiibacterium carminicum]PAS99881.1 MAG: RNA polymerase subunit sigma [Candidatus Dactylopiibacterium carminicum]
MSTAATCPPDVLSDLYTGHHGWLQGWLRRKLGCHERAADLAQDTFLRLLGQPGPADLSEPRALLAHIAKGLLIDHWRRQAVERAYLESVAHLPEAECPSPETRYLILEALYSIERMLREMPDKTREIFLLSQLDGMTYPQIATRLGVSLITVKRHMKAGFVACMTAL